MQATSEKQTYEGIAATLREIGYSTVTAAMVADVHGAVRSGQNIPHGPTGAAVKMYVIVAIQGGVLDGVA